MWLKNEVNNTTAINSVIITEDTISFIKQQN